MITASQNNTSMMQTGPAFRDARIAVVMVNYNLADFLGGQFKAIAQAGRGAAEFQIYVADNTDLGDDYDKLLSAAQDLPVTIIKSPRNGGFAYGNNMCLRALRWITTGESSEQQDWPDYVFFLNPDTEIFPETISSLANFLHATPDAGIAGAKIIDIDGVAQASAFNDPSFKTAFFGSMKLAAVDRLVPEGVIHQPEMPLPKKVDWVTGAAFMLTQATLEKVGLMDQGYFLYFEEVDYMREARSAGFDIWHVPAARAIHLEGAATGLGSANAEKVAKKALPAYWYQSWLRYHLKYYGRIGTIARALGQLSGNSIQIVHHGLRGKSTDLPKRALRDFAGKCLWGAVSTPMPKKDIGDG
ncbi:MAG: glycosyltransferase family 2 protein [Parvularculaceae bacterium]